MNADTIKIIQHSDATAAHINQALIDFQPELPKREVAPVMAALLERVNAEQGLLGAIIPGVFASVRFFAYRGVPYDKASAYETLMARVFPTLKEPLAQEGLRRPEQLNRNLTDAITQDDIALFTRIIAGKVDFGQGHVGMANPAPQYMAGPFTNFDTGGDFGHLKHLLFLRPELAEGMMRGAIALDGSNNWKVGVEQAMGASSIITMIAKNPEARGHIDELRFAAYVRAIVKTPIGEGQLNELVALGDERLKRIIEENRDADGKRFTVLDRLAFKVGEIARMMPV